MPIGNPVTLTSNVASKTISATATASQTLFNVTGGYRINQLSVFRNGVRLVNGQDFTARDGLTVRLLNAANLNDTLQFQVFDTFRIAEAIGPNVDEQTIRGNLNVVGILSCTDLEGPVNLNITSGIQTFHDVRVGGALTVAGTITYEDVGNTNTTGIATFSGGMLITGVGATTTTLNVTGVSTFAGAINGNLTGNATGLSGTPNIDCGTGSFTGDVDIADKIIHTGDTNTAIRFPASDTFTVETAGSERLRVNTSGTITTGISTADGFRVGDSEYISVGAGGTGDMLLYHNGTDSYVQDIGTGSLILSGSRFIVKNAADNEKMIDASEDGAVELYHNNVKKFETGPAGTITVGVSTADGFEAGDDERLKLGADQDLQLYHDGANSWLINNTGDFSIRNLADDKDVLIQSDDGSGGFETYIQADGSTRAAKLFHSASVKLETTATGVTVTGTLNATTALTQNGTALASTGKAIAMALIFG